MNEPRKRDDNFMSCSACGGSLNKEYSGPVILQCPTCGYMGPYRQGADILSAEERMEKRDQHNRYQYRKREDEV